MIRCKVFEFEVSNASSHAFPDDRKSTWYSENKFKLYDAETIEQCIDNFLIDESVKEVVSMNINTIDVHYHNNGRGNTVKLVYTILYK